MKRTKLQMTMVAFVAAMLLGGCGEEPYELTDNEEQLIVNYSAHIVTKYNTYQKEGLSYVWPEEIDETESALIDQPATSEQVNTETEPQEAMPEQAGGEQLIDSSLVPITLTELFGEPGVTINYVGARLSANYSESAYYAQYPDSGKQYLILGIDITNNGEYPVSLDYVTDTSNFKVILNNEITSLAEITFLADDFSNFEAIMDAGETCETVLLFQVPDTVISVDNVDLIVNGENNYHIILENE